MTFGTPVAVIVFNRPDETQKVFDAVASLKPSMLYVIADGPREENSNDEQLCSSVRRIFDRVDWRCELIRDFSETNLGCGRRPYTGITSLFEMVEEAIILEDDCVPDASFFRFCGELLERYRNDTRIMQISGFNYINKIFGYRTSHSYHFHKAFACWGWATWRRAWHSYDFAIRRWPLLKASGYLRDYLSNADATSFVSSLFDDTYSRSGQIDYWDYQLWHAIWSENGLAVAPNVNLVENIGIAGGGTHFQGGSPNDDLCIACERMEFPLVHPPFVLRDPESDRLRFRYILERNKRGRVGRRERLLRAATSRFKGIWGAR